LENGALSTVSRKLVYRRYANNLLEIGASATHYELQAGELFGEWCVANAPYELE
jgi:hypothetical protein